MPAISPFRALRYDEEVAGPLVDLVAPPYDVIDDDARRELQSRSANNIAHLTLPDWPGGAQITLMNWRSTGVLVEDEPALWWVTQDYVGPDGVERTREGIAGIIDVTPYSARQVLPHERTHSGPKEARLDLLRATRTQLEPIFLLYDDDPPVTRPDGDPDMDVSEEGMRTRVWRIPSGPVEVASAFLIADGHHRYESAVELCEEDETLNHIYAVFVSARAPGLEIFPTHRLVKGLGVEPELEPTDEWDRDALALYRDGQYFRVASDEELDAKTVEAFAPEGVTYTAYADEAIGAVDRGEAAAAFLVRAPTIEQVAEFARRGEMMPQKSTFFYPKLTSGLLLYPL